MGFRLRFIIGLILIAVSLHFTAKTLRGLLTIFISQAQHIEVQHAPQTENHSLFSQILGRSKDYSLHVKKFVAAKKTKVPAASTSEMPPEPVPSGPVILEIIDEEPPPPLSNPFLEEENSARLEQQLAQQRADHAQLTQEVQALFGLEAQQKVIEALTQHEHTSYKNAQTCRSIEKCIKRQKEIDQKAQNRLNRIFEKYKDSFNYKSKSGSKEWNEFYWRVNNFRRAKD